MNTELVAKELLHLKETDSTNSALKEMVAQKNLSEGFCLYTDYQKAGRGQYGKEWQSDPGQNLLMSVYLKPSFLPPDQAYRLTMSVCLALADMGQELDLETQFKWPNDWYYGRKKLAGVLIEASLQKGIIQSCIIGIGINVKQRSYGDLKAIGLEEAAQRDLNRDDVLVNICEALDHRYRQLKMGLLDLQHQEFQEMLWGSKLSIPVLVEGERQRGICLGVEPGGDLLFQFSNGEIRKFRHREIEFIMD